MSDIQTLWYRSESGRFQRSHSFETITTIQVIGEKKELREKNENREEKKK